MSMVKTLRKLGPKVTVLMTVYNGERFIRESIESILNQTFRDFEFIIINDGSTDASSEIIRSFVDTRIRLIDNKKNFGVYRSANKGLKLAKGKYIARQDDDDISLPTRLAEQVKFLETHRTIALVGTNYTTIDGKGNPLTYVRLKKNDADIKEKLVEHCAVCHPSMMFRRSVLDSAGYYREKFDCAGDYDFIKRISEHHKVANLDKDLYQLRRGIQSISSDKLSKQLSCHLLIIELAKERRQRGKDSLDILRKKDMNSVGSIDDILNKKYKVQRSRINGFKSEICLGYFKESLKAEDKRLALKYWLNAFRLEPRKWKIRYLLENIAPPPLGRTQQLVRGN